MEKQLCKNKVKRKPACIPLVNGRFKKKKKIQYFILLYVSCYTFLIIFLYTESAITQKRRIIYIYRSNTVMEKLFFELTVFQVSNLTYSKIVKTIYNHVESQASLLINTN